MLASVLALASCGDNTPMATESGTAGDGDGDGVCPDQAIMDDLPISLMGSNQGTGDDFDPSCDVGSFGGEDVSFTWTAPADGSYQIDTFGSDYDTVLTVQDGTCVDGPELGCNDDGDPMDITLFQSMLIVDLLMGQEITIQLDSYDSTGTYVLNISEAP
jgi:hypothetical protein